MFQYVTGTRVWMEVHVSSMILVIIVNALNVGPDLAVTWQCQDVANRSADPAELDSTVRMVTYQNRNKLPPVTYYLSHLLYFKIPLSIGFMVRAQFLAVAECFKIFFDWSHSVHMCWASMTENGSICPQWHRTTCRHRKGKYQSSNGRTMVDIQSFRSWNKHQLQLCHPC